MTDTVGAGLSAEDRLMIHDLYARYAWAEDQGDLDAFADCFTEDAVVRLLDEARGRDEIRRREERFVAEDSGFPGAQHFASQLEITGGDGRAEVRAYAARLHRIPGTTSGQLLWQGFYTDRCERHAGRWYFSLKWAHPAEHVRLREAAGVPRVIARPYYHHGDTAFGHTAPRELGTTKYGE